MTVAATDGSCLGNPGPGGWAWVTTDGRCGSAAARHTTNNRMELRAVLELLRHTDPDTDDPLTIQTDSVYVMNIFTKWLEGWKRRGMRTASRKPVENADLIKMIDEELQGRRVQWEKVPAHMGHALNEEADTLAREAAERAAARLRAGG